METELKIVYAILETVKRQGNDDSEIGERFIRGLMQSYRSELINDYFSQGLTVSEECYQYLGQWVFYRADNGTTSSYAGAEYVTDVLPKIIRMQNFGLMIEKNGVNIPIVNSEEYNLGKKHLITKYNPKAKFLGKKLTIYIGRKRSDCAGADEANAFFDAWGIVPITATPFKQIYADVNAILDNPDQANDFYNWRTDPYPFPSELIAQMKEDILRKEFNIILQTKNDKVTNGNASEVE